MHGANRLGGNSLSDLLVFGRADGRGAAAHAGRRPEASRTRPGHGRGAARGARRAARATRARTPYAVHARPPGDDAALVGIFRIEADLDEALARAGEVPRALATVGVTGGRAFNPGWNLVFELRNLLDGVRGDRPQRAQRTESRGAHSRLDYPATDDGTGATEQRRRSATTRMDGRHGAAARDADELRSLLAADH